MEIHWTSRLYQPFREFTTTHVDGKPLTISSLGQLRQVERQFGVNFPAYGGSLMPGQRGLSQSTWEDAEGHTHHD